MHHQSVIQHFWRWRAPSVNLWMIQTLSNWPLCIATAYSRVGRERASYGESRLTSCETPAEEMPQSGGNHYRARCAELYTILHKVQPSSLCYCSTCLHKVRTYLYIYKNIFIYIYIHYIPSKFSKRTQSIASLRSLMITARQLIWLALAIILCKLNICRLLSTVYPF